MAGEATMTLILGGARSGKSRYALMLAAQASGGAPAFIATATAGDAEMAARIAEHKRERGAGFETIEAPLDLAGALRAASRPGRAAVVDCLTFWLNNLTMERRDVAAETQGLLEALDAAPGPVILVSNEVGLGIVPDNALAREFRDRAGRLHQAVAARADRVIFMAAGLPLSLKGGTRGATVK